MSNFLQLLFDGKKPLPVHTATITPEVSLERQHLNESLKKINQKYYKINKDAKKMKEEIDIALAIALTTGGLSVE